MSLNPSGSNPIITVNYGGIDFARCRLFFKKLGDPSFSTILTHDNGASKFTFTIDPVERLGADKKISDLIGCELNWTIVFIDFDNTPTSQYSFDLAVKQDGRDLLTPPFSKVGSITNSSVTFGNRFIFD
jgi:hypothetical protein